MKATLRKIIFNAYSAFGHHKPDEAIVDVALAAVPDDGDDGFALFVADMLATLDRLPQNLGQYLARVLYPQYVATLIAAYGVSQCGLPECSECGGSGWHDVWHPGAAPGTAPTALPCICNLIVDAWSSEPPQKHRRIDLLRAGWTFEAPAPVRYGMPVSLDRFEATRGKTAA